MKTLKYTYWLLSVLLSCVVMLSCDEDDETENIKDETEDVLYSEGDTITTDITIGVSVPVVDVSAEVTTRAANINNANTSASNLENGGLFQNLIVFILDHEGRLRGIHRKEFVTATDNYTWVFRSVKGVVGKEFKAYAFGNVPTEDFDGYWGKLESKVTEQVTISRVTTDKLSVDNVYNINFEVGKQTYKINGTPMTSTGMPMNNVTTFDIQKGNNDVSIAMKRVCARLEIKVHNEKSNPIYVDKLKLTNCIASNTGYFTGYSVSPTYVGFDIDSFFVSSEQGHHIVERNNDMTLAFYVFEGNSTYTYDVKIDRGKNLKKVTVPEDGNVYAVRYDYSYEYEYKYTVIEKEEYWEWDRLHYVKKERDVEVEKTEMRTAYAYQCLSYTPSQKIYVNDQQQSEDFNFNDQILWQFVRPSNAKMDNVFVLKHFPVNTDNDALDKSKDNGSDVYLKEQYLHKAPLLVNDMYYDPVSNINSAQGVHFKYKNGKHNAIFIDGHNSTTDLHFVSYTGYMIVDNNKLRQRTRGAWNDDYDYIWFLYEKYLNQTGSKTLKKERNTKYEIKFDVK